MPTAAWSQLAKTRKISQRSPDRAEMGSPGSSDSHQHGCHSETSRLGKTENRHSITPLTDLHTSLARMGIQKGQGAASAEAVLCRVPSALPLSCLIAAPRHPVPSSPQPASHGKTAPHTDQSGLPAAPRGGGGHGSSVWPLRPPPLSWLRLQQSFRELREAAEEGQQKQGICHSLGGHMARRRASGLGEL